MNHSVIIGSWPSLTDFANDLGVGYETAKGMRRRGTIPPGYWVRTVVAAQVRGIDKVTYERLAELVAIPELVAKPMEAAE